MPRTSKRKVQEQPKVVKADATEQGEQLIETVSAKPVEIGDMVLFVTKNGANRPAIVVEKWSDKIVNLQVFTDMRNDGYLEPVIWIPNVSFGTEGYQWHWPK